MFHREYPMCFHSLVMRLHHGEDRLRLLQPPLVRPRHALIEVFPQLTDHGGCLLIQSSDHGVFVRRERRLLGRYGITYIIVSI